MLEEEVVVLSSTIEVPDVPGIPEQAGNVVKNLAALEQPSAHLVVVD